VRKSKRLPNTYLRTNAWRLLDSEFDSLNILFSFTLEACCDLDGFNRHGLLPFYSEKDSFLSHDIAGQFVYCNPHWSLAVRCVEHIRTCHAKSSINTKVVIVLLYWPQFNEATTGLRLLSQILTDTLVFTKSSPLKKRNNVVKVPWFINYWVANKNTPMKVSATRVKSVISASNVGNANSKFDIASHWLPTTATITIMDPNQPKPLMNLLISIE